MPITSFSIVLTLFFRIGALLLILPAVVTSQAVWVYIDAGHGGTDPGSSTPIADYAEKDINLQVALRLQEINRWPATMSRTFDTTVDRTSRAYQANSLNAQIFVSVHHNAPADPQPSGIQRTEALYSTWPHPEGDDNPWRAMWRDTTELLAKKIGFRVRDIFHYGLSDIHPINKGNTVTVLSRTFMPSAISEGSFTYEYAEAANFYYNTDDHVGKEATAIWEAFSSFLITGQGIAQVDYEYQEKGQNDPTFVKIYDPLGQLITYKVPYTSCWLAGEQVGVIAQDFVNNYTAPH